MDRNRTRSSPFQDRLGLPHLYDTSTSTTDDSHSSGPRLLRPKRLASPASSDPPEQHSSTIYPSRHPSVRKTIPKVRKAASDTGVSTGGYDLYMQEYMHSRRTAASPPNRSTLEFQDEYNHEQISFQNRPTKQQLRREDRRVGSIEQTSRPRGITIEGMGRNNGSANQQHDEEENRTGSTYTDLKSRFIDLAVQSRNQSIHRYRKDPVESFETSKGTPSKPSVVDLKRQLWPDDETLQLSHSQKRVLDERFEGSQQVSHSLSPSRRIINDSTFDSDTTGGTANFKSKYYQAALMAAREREDQEAGRANMRFDDPPKIRRNIVERPRTSSRGEESTFSVPFDEKGRTRSQSVPRSRPYPASLNMPALHSSYKTGDRQAMNQEPRGYNASLSPPMTGFRKQPTAPSAFSRSSDHEQLQSRRHSPSPAIKQRVEEFSRVSRGRSPPRSHSYHTRTIFQESRSRNVDGSHGEFDGRAHGNMGTEVANVHIPGQSIFKEPIRRYTTIKDGPTERLPASERRPGTPPVKMPAKDESSNRPEVDLSGHKHAGPVSSWHERVRVSPRFLTPDSSAAYSSRSSDHKRAVVSPEAGFRSSEAGSSYPDQQHVAELVAKLSAVDRANPVRALAQIDSILRQESRSNSAGTTNSENGSPIDLRNGGITNQFEDNNGDAQSDGDSDYDDDTTVSSITNPSFQIVNRDNYATAEAEGGKPPNPFAVSTSSFRPPRPSSLQNYSQSHENKAGKTSTKAREAPERYNIHPPPMSVNVREQQELSPFGNNPHGFGSSPIRIPVTPDPNDPRSPPASVWPRSEVGTSWRGQDAIRDRMISETSISVEATPVEIDSALYDGKASEIQTRLHRKAGHEGKKSDPDGHGARSGADRGRGNSDHGHHQLRITSTKRHRAHPWEADTPDGVQKILISPTSMEDAAGLELNLRRKHAMTIEQELPRSPLSPKINLSPTPQQNSHFKGPIHERALLEALPDDPAVLFDHRLHVPDKRAQSKVQSPVHTPDASPLAHQDSRILARQRQPQRETSGLFPDMELGVQATPSKQPDSPHNPFSPSTRPLSPEVKTDSFTRKQDNGTLSQTSRESKRSFADSPDNEASSDYPYVSSTRNDAGQMHVSRRRGAPVDLDTSIDTSVSEVNRFARTNPIKPPSRDALYDEGRTEVERGAIEVTWLSDSDDLNTSGESGPSERSGHMGSRGALKSSDNSSRRNLIRSFMRKDGKKNPGMTQTPSNLPTKNSRATPQIYMQPVLPAYCESRTAEGRGQMEFSPSSREKSRSSSHDRFRSPNMAQKFGRVMRLYDDQD